MSLLWIFIIAHFIVYYQFKICSQHEGLWHHWNKNYIIVIELAEGNIF